jgi:hypothetical protein
MGSDFFYFGKLPQPALQEMVINMVQSYYSDYLSIYPMPESKYCTLARCNVKKEKRTSYPFDYFGVIPNYGYFIQGQFVFDRTAEGELVTLLKYPGSCGISTDAGGDSEIMDIEEGVEVYTNSGGYCRLIEGREFALLLNIIRLRYWRDLSASDDYNEIQEVGEMIEAFGLVSAMKDWRLDFPACLRIFGEEYQKRLPRFELPSKPERDLKVVPPNVMEIFLDTLEMSIRTGNCLRNAGIKTVGELMTFTPVELGKIKNLGSKSVNEIKEILWGFGVHLRSE